jgi:hypothetical protein
MSAEQQVVTFLPPNRPFGGTERAAEAVGEMLDWVGCGNDLVQLGRQFLDPRTALSSSDPAGHGQTPDCRSHAKHVATRYPELSNHGRSSLPAIERGCATVKKP